MQSCFQITVTFQSDSRHSRRGVLAKQGLRTSAGLVPVPWGHKASPRAVTPHLKGVSVTKHFQKQRRAHLSCTHLTLGFETPREALWASGNTILPHFSANEKRITHSPALGMDISPLLPKKRGGMNSDSEHSDGCDSLEFHEPEFHLEPPPTPQTH